MQLSPFTQWNSFSVQGVYTMVAGLEELVLQRM